MLKLFTLLFDAALVTWLAVISYHLFEGSCHSMWIIQFWTFVTVWLLAFVNIVGLREKP
jgi:hypothetical protein